MDSTLNAPKMALHELSAIGERLRTQDDRITQNPMFCAQIKVRDTGYDSNYSDNQCWWNAGLMEVVYDTEPTGKGWDGPFGYKDRWETVMVAFTEGGCEEYLRLNGHNDKRRAHNGEVRIYVQSFNRCPEMIAIREALIALHDAVKASAAQGHGTPTPVSQTLSGGRNALNLQGALEALRGVAVHFSTNNRVWHCETCERRVSEAIKALQSTQAASDGKERRD